MSEHPSVTSRSSSSASSGSSTRSRAPAPAGNARVVAERSFDVAEDGALGARGNERLAQSLHVDIGAAAVAALAGLERHHREDAVGPDPLAVAEVDHAPWHA